MASLKPSVEVSSTFGDSNSSTVTVVVDGESATVLSLNCSFSMFSRVSVPSRPFTVQVPLAFRAQV